MAYVGNEPVGQYSSVTKDTFSGNGSNTSFTLTNPGTTNGVEVFVENVRQEPTTAYSVSGTTLTFTAAPASGTNNIYVVNKGTPASSIEHPSDNDLTANAGTFSSNITVSGSVGTSTTGALKLPAGTIAQRPSSPVTGMIRQNTDDAVVEAYNGTSWEAVGQQVVTYTIDALIVAGGGGGAGAAGGGGGGGGAGGMQSLSNELLTAGTQYDITVGGAGAAGATNSGAASNGTDGEDSVFAGVTSIGGGGGGGGQTSQTGQDGGSGGGGGYSNNLAGSGTSGQGNDGGRPTSGHNGGGGGGGKGAVGGTTPAGTSGGPGGIGGISTIISSTIATAQSVGEVSGSDVYFAGGGGGSSNNTGGSGGLGGGGDAGTGSNATASTAGTTNTGGGGGAGYGSTGIASAGGSGVVILRMPTARYSGTTTNSPTVVTDGSDTILIFKSSGSYTA